jgi:hypothetical protein
MRRKRQEWVMEREEYEEILRRLFTIEALLALSPEQQLPIPAYARDHLEGLRRMRAHLDWLLAQLKGR